MGQFDWWLGAHQASALNKTYTVAVDDLKAYVRTHPINVDDVQSGFYASRNRDRSYDVAAIWRDENGNLLGRRGADRMMSAESIVDSWPYLANRPISHVAYKQFLATGTLPERPRKQRAKENA